MGIHFRERESCVPVWLTIEPATRRRIEAAIENLLALLDQIDGDCDLEPDTADHEHDTADLEPDGTDREPDGTDEAPDVPAATTHFQRQWSYGYREDAQ